MQSILNPGNVAVYLVCASPEECVHGPAAPRRAPAAAPGRPAPPPALPTRAGRPGCSTLHFLQLQLQSQRIALPLLVAHPFLPLCPSGAPGRCRRGGRHTGAVLSRAMGAGQKGACKELVQRHGLWVSIGGPVARLLAGRGLHLRLLVGRGLPAGRGLHLRFIVGPGLLVGWLLLGLRLLLQAWLPVRLRTYPSSWVGYMELGSLLLGWLQGPWLLLCCAAANTFPACAGTCRGCAAAASLTPPWPGRGSKECLDRALPGQHRCSTASGAGAGCIREGHS